jgi:hypothetical protein
MELGPLQKCGSGKKTLVETLLKSTIVPVARPYDDWVPGRSLKDSPQTAPISWVHI